MLSNLPAMVLIVGLSAPPDTERTPRFALSALETRPLAPLNQPPSRSRFEIAGTASPWRPPAAGPSARYSLTRGAGLCGDDALLADGFESP